MRAAALLTVALLIPCASALTASCLVSPDGNGDFPDIQSAVDSAANGDTITLGDGRFVGPGNRQISIHAKAVVLRSQSGDPATCILDCLQQGRAFVFGNPQDSASPLQLPGMPRRADPHKHSSVIEGITVMNGSADRGGAVICHKHADPMFASCIFTGNHATETGGALHFRQSRAILRECVIAHNSAAEAGGGISICCCAHPNISRTTIAYNTAPHAAGISCVGMSVLSMSHSIVAFCGPGSALGCSTEARSCKPRFECCNLHGNAGGDWTDCAATMCGTAGNFSGNPLFQNPEDGDFSLRANSPCSRAHSPCGTAIGAHDH
jgi:hypothetical protein